MKRRLPTVERRLLPTPGWIATIVTVVAIVVVESSAADMLVALAGAVVGLLAILAASQLGLLAGVPVAGVRVRRVVVGVGPRLGDWSTPTRTFIVRAIPVIMSVLVRAGRPPVRTRLWVSTLYSAIAELAVVVAAVSGDSVFLDGFAIACVAEFLHAMLPRRTSTSMSTGWVLFRLPLADDHARQLDASPLIGEAIDLTRTGNLAAAEVAAARLRETYPDLRSALAARVIVLEAQGRYAEAMVLAVKLASDDRQRPDEAADSFAALAGLAAVTVEAGQLDSELGLNTATQALENASTLGYPNYKLNGVRALLELLNGNPTKAINLATLSASSGDDLLIRADDLATLARAHMASGDNRTARQVLGEAEKLASWWPRVSGTRSRLEVS